jgi:polycomb protein EED
MQWYGDLILSHACREDKIILWRIDNFSSDRCNTPPAPVPTSASVTSTTPVTIPAKSTSTTRSAWGGRLQRVLQFDLPHSQSWYSRFSIFHQLGRHPVLVAGNDKSKAFFWDLERLEKSHMGEEESRAGEGTSLPLGIPQHIREGSTTSNASSSVSVGVAAIVKKKMRRKKEPTIDRGISDLFHLISAHKVIEVPKHKDFTFRNFAWSLDGQWCVGVGDAG